MLSKGLLYEKVAQQYLEQAGLRTLTANYRSRFGEIDLVMRDGRTLVFVEVRFRKSSCHGSASESITRAKQQKIIKSAKLYLSQHNLWHLDSRFDVIAISPASEPLKEDHHVQWHKAAFLC